MPDRRSRSRSRSPRRGEESTGREERKRERKKRTGWDVGAEEGAATAGAAGLGAAGFGLTQVLAQQQGSLLMQNLGKGVQPAAATQLLGLGAGASLAALQNTALMQNQRNMMCRIYVGSLDYYLTELEIKSVFQAFGTIVSVDMPKEGDRSKGFCFVEYASPEAAEMALSTMQNFVLKGRTIKVGRPTAVGTGGQQVQRTNVMPTTALSPMGPAAGGSAAGRTAAAGIMHSAQAGAAAATAILAGRSGAAGETTNLAGLLATNQTTVMTPDQQMVHQQLLHQQQQVANNRVYIGNVPFGFSSEDLKKIFVVFGPILSCQLLPSQENPQQHRGYGFIEYATPEAAKLAIETMNGFEVAGKQLKVNFATAMRNSPAAAAQNVVSPLAAAGYNLGLGGMAAGLGISPLAAAPLGQAAAATNLHGAATGANTAAVGASLPVALGAGVGAAGQPAAGAGVATAAGAAGTAVPPSLAAAPAGVPVGLAALAGAQTLTGAAGGAGGLPATTATGPPTSAGSGLKNVTTTETAAGSTSAGAAVNGGGPNASSPHAGDDTKSKDSTSTSAENEETKPLPPPPTVIKSPVMMLVNMVAPEEVDAELKEEVREECSKFGSIKRVEVQVMDKDVRIFVYFTDVAGAVAAIPSLHGRWFGGRQIIANTYEERLFLDGVYTA